MFHVKHFLLNFLFFSAFSVLVALLGGGQYSQNAGFLLNQYSCGDLTLRLCFLTEKRLSLPFLPQ